MRPQWRETGPVALPFMESVRVHPSLFEGVRLGEGGYQRKEAEHPECQPNGCGWSWSGVGRSPH